MVNPVMAARPIAGGAGRTGGGGGEAAGVRPRCLKHRPMRRLVRRGNVIVLFVLIRSHYRKGTTASSGCCNTCSGGGGPGLVSLPFDQTGTRFLPGYRERRRHRQENRCIVCDGDAGPRSD